MIEQFGNDTYLYSLGDGSDTIDDWEGYDVLRFSANIKPADVAVRTEGDDVIFSFAGGGQILVWYGAYREYAIEQVQFADGTVWKYEGFPSINGGWTPASVSLSAFSAESERAEASCNFSRNGMKAVETGDWSIHFSSNPDVAIGPQLHAAALEPFIQ